jgi:type VI secretion system protein ImpH
MAAVDGNADRSVAARLSAEPFDFEFFQAVSLLERMRPDATSVGEGVNVDREAVRFEAEPSLDFPASDIVSLKQAPAKNAPSLMRVAFFTLAGVQGPLPRAYIERMLGARSKSTALKAFLNIFHHRLVSIFYRARRKRRLALDGRPPEQSIAAPMLRAIAGLDNDAFAGRLHVPEGATLRYAAMLAQRPRSALGLERMLTSYFGVAIRVRQFIGRWRTLEPEDGTCLGRSANVLGDSAVLGDRVWDQSGRVRLVIGPLTLKHYMDFLPGGNAMPSLLDLTKLYLGPEMEVECQLVLRAGEVPPAWLSSAADTRLGLTSWLETAGARTRHAMVTIDAGRA